MPAPLYQGSRPSLADYAPLGLDASEPVGGDRIGLSARKGCRTVVEETRSTYSDASDRGMAAILLNGANDMAIDAWEVL